MRLHAPFARGCLILSSILFCTAVTTAEHGTQVVSSESTDTPATPANSKTTRLPDPRIARLPAPIGNVAQPPQIVTSARPTSALSSNNPPWHRSSTTRSQRTANKTLAKKSLREKNCVASPLSGRYNFDQPMEALESTNHAKTTTPVGIEHVTLPANVAQRAAELLQSATLLADRGAIYAANLEFLRVMRMVTQSLDSQIGSQYHTRALAAGLRALEEADDFSLTKGDSVEDDVHLSTFVKGHGTPVLKNADLNQITTLRAIQEYYEYARKQLAVAAGNTPLGSRALFAMGRAQMFLGKEESRPGPGTPKSLALFHAAMLSDPNNSRAANELAVMLARRGRQREAANILQSALQRAPLPAAASNLATLYERAQDPRAADMRQNANQLAQNHPAGMQLGGSPRITWVDPATFAATGDQPATRGAAFVESTAKTSGDQIGRVNWHARTAHPNNSPPQMISPMRKNPQASQPKYQPGSMNQWW